MPRPAASKLAADSGYYHLAEAAVKVNAPCCSRRSTALPRSTSSRYEWLSQQDRLMISRGVIYHTLFTQQIEMIALPPCVLTPELTARLQV